MEEGHDHGHSLSLSVKLFLLFLALQQQVEFGEGVWCVSRSGASDDALQSALDYACAAGADCTPIQQSGLCFLPNTLQAHASYAFNSFYQRNHMSASSCDFSATATLAQTDPSYGSCVYPASPSTAGGITSTSTGNSPTTNPYGTGSPLTPTINTTSSSSSSSSTIGGGGGGPAGDGTGFNPTNMGPPIPTTNDSGSALKSSLLLFLLLSLALN